MFREIFIFLLRSALVVMLWMFVWGLIKPKTQLLRILRAALLVLGFLGILVVMRVAA